LHSKDGWPWGLASRSSSLAGAGSSLKRLSRWRKDVAGGIASSTRVWSLSLKEILTHREPKTFLRACFSLFVYAGLWVSGSAKPQDDISPETRKVLLHMDQTNQSLADLMADVTETKVTIVVNDTSVSTGKLFYKRAKNGSKTKLEYDKPELKTLLIDKDKVWVYEPKIKHLQEIDLGKSHSQEAFFVTGIGQSGSAIAKSYDVKLLNEEALDGTKTSLLELKPKSEKVSALFTKILLWIDQSRWVPIQTRLTESTGDYLTIRFENMRFNPNLPDKTFKLSIPSDVEKSSYRGH
jgi:outer membrane lipoprotein-sorting protein